MNTDLALCAQINFENLEKALPQIKSVSYYIIAKSQLDEAIDGKVRIFPEPGKPYDKEMVES